MANVYATQVWFTASDAGKPTSNFASGQLLYARDTNIWYVADSNTTWQAMIASGSILSGSIGRTHLSSGCVNSGHLNTTGTPGTSVYLRGDLAWVTPPVNYNFLSGAGLTTDSYSTIGGLSFSANNWGLVFFGSVKNTSGVNNMDVRASWYDVWGNTENYDRTGIASGGYVDFNSMMVSGSIVHLGFSSGVIQVKSSSAGNPTGYAIRATYL